MIQFPLKNVLVFLSSCGELYHRKKCSNCSLINSSVWAIRKNSSQDIDALLIRPKIARPVLPPDGAIIPSIFCYLPMLRTMIYDCLRK